MNLKQTALTSAVVAGLAWGAGANAYVLGPGSEGLLVPVAMWSNLAPAPVQSATDAASLYGCDTAEEGSTGGSCYYPIIDTLVYLHTMSTLLRDVVPQQYTAPNVAAAGGPDFGRTCNVDANGNYKWGKGNGDLEFNDVPCDEVHWAFFDATSKHIKNSTFPVTPDDKFVFSLAKHLEGTYQGVPGYLVFLTEKAMSGEAANFIMAADAILRVFETETEIPVFGLADGNDGPPPTGSGGKITRTNNVVVGLDGKTIQLSPTVTGTRLNDGSGNPGLVDVDVQYFPRKWYTNVFVTWLDDNYSEYKSVMSNIFDDDQNDDSYLWPLDCELNINVFDDNEYTFKRFTQIFWGGDALDCVRFMDQIPYPGPDKGYKPGFVRFHLPQVGPAGDGATAAGIFLNLVFSSWYPVMDGKIAPDNSVACTGSCYWAPGSVTTFLGKDVGKK